MSKTIADQKKDYKKCKMALTKVLTCISKINEEDDVNKRRQDFIKCCKNLKADLNKMKFGRGPAKPKKKAV